jgi:hypothetical protein
MTVLKLEQGGLFIYAPVAPTKECLGLLQPLIDAHGPVKFIVLPSVAPEHKVLAGPFARKFPKAEFYTTDKQYAFPLNLPSTWLGFPAAPKLLPPSSAGLDLWGGELEHEVLTAKASKESIYQDAAFFHKPSRTVLLCDALIGISAEPPPILTSTPEYTRALYGRPHSNFMPVLAHFCARWRGPSQQCCSPYYLLSGTMCLSPPDCTTREMTLLNMCLTRLRCAAKAGSVLHCSQTFLCQAAW